MLGTLMPVMQRKSMGQERRKQGAHGTFAVSNWWRASPGSPGPVSAGEALGPVGYGGPAA